MKKLHQQFQSWKGVTQNEFISQKENVPTKLGTDFLYNYNGAFDNKQEAETAWRLAVGRILSMGSRPAKEGDKEMMIKCEDIIKDAYEYLKI